MEEGSMENVFCNDHHVYKAKHSQTHSISLVLPYIHDGHDRNSISLVSPKFYDLDRISRKHLTVHLFYAQNPSTLSKRFPFIESLTLKGLPDTDALTPATPWITEISALAKTRGKDLRTLKICSFEGFSEEGLLHISRYCNHLRCLCLEFDIMDGDHPGEWLRELASHNTPIESLHLSFHFINFNVEDLTLVARSCSNSLVSLKITPKSLHHLRDAFTHAIKLQDFDDIIFDKGGDYTCFKFPPSIRALGIHDLPVTSFSLLLPYVNQLRELNLTSYKVKGYCPCFLIERCPNLEVLRTNDVCGDSGLQIIGQVCKKLRKLIHIGRVTQMGLIDLVQGCTDLEVLGVNVSDNSNEAIECVGTHLKNLRDFRMTSCKEEGTGLPLDNGIRAMLKGCIKLERLELTLRDEELTDVGLGYIGK